MEVVEGEECWECIGAMVVKARFADWLRIQAILAVNVDNASVGGLWEADFLVESRFLLCTSL